MSDSSLPADGSQEHWAPEPLVLSEEEQTELLASLKKDPRAPEDLQLPEEEEELESILTLHAALCPMDLVKKAVSRYPYSDDIAGLAIGSFRKAGNITGMLEIASMYRDSPELEPVLRQFVRENTPVNPAEVPDHLRPIAEQIVAARRLAAEQEATRKKFLRDQLFGPVMLSPEPVTQNTAIAAPLTETDDAAYHATLAGHREEQAYLERSHFLRYPHDAPVIERLAEKAAEDGKPLRTLIIGVGNGEEPLTYLSLMKRSGNKPLSDLADLHCVDIRPAEALEVPEKKWRRAAADLLPDASTRDAAVSDVRSTFDAVMSDPDRAHFSTSVESYVGGRKPDDEQFDLVSCNNVLQWLGKDTYDTPYHQRGLPPERYAQYLSYVQGIMDRVRPGGILIMHTPDPGEPIGSKERSALVMKLLPPDVRSRFVQVYREGGIPLHGVFRRIR